MSKRVVVAGATGNLGERIVSELLRRKAGVTALARIGTGDEKLAKLKDLGAEVAIVDMASVEAIARYCAGAECVVSSLQGLRDVVVNTQSILLDAALQAGVPRFIPSDFSTDFWKQPVGENRNFDLRREFHARLHGAPIAATAIFNGAFAEVLTYNIPLLDFQKKTVGYWGDPDWRIDFTTMDDTAAFTAATAIDSETPEALHIASFQVTPRELQAFTATVLGAPFELVRMGAVNDLAKHNRQERAAHPEGEQELYPRWQQGQYMQSMLSVQHPSLDNGRYPDVTWTPLAQVIRPKA